MPVNIARLYAEDLVPEQEEVKELKENKSKQNLYEDDIILKIEERKEEISKRKSCISRQEDEELEYSIVSKAKSEKLYSRAKGPNEEDIETYDFEDFKIITFLGSGTYGKVYLVKNEKNGKRYAMKSIRKDIVLDCNSLESLKNEKSILLQVRHPFIISMDHVYALETRIYFIMPFVQGGDLFQHIEGEIRFSERRVQFYAA